MNNSTYPLTDALMQYDEESGRYVLTEEALVQNGTDLRARLSYTNTPNVTGIITRHLNRVSDVIYDYIHSYSMNNLNQDRYIAKIPTLRRYIYKAMLAQSEYMLLNGDLTMSTDARERANAIDYNAKAVLETVVPELGRSILYMGV
jgi:hypothetical protein